MTAHEPLAAHVLGRWIATCTHGCCHQIPTRFGTVWHATEAEATEAAVELVRLAENGPDETRDPALYDAVTRDRQALARDIETVLETVHPSLAEATYRRCDECGLLQAVLEVSEEQIGAEEQAREVLAWHLACGHTDETPLRRAAS